MRLALLTFGLAGALTSGLAAQAFGPSSTRSITAKARAAAEAAAVGGDTRGKPDQASNPDRPKRVRFQLGVALKSTTTPGIDTSDSLEPTLVWRWRGKGSRTDDRWAPAYRFSSFGSQVSSQLGRTELPVGDIKVRPLMLGLDYKMPRGKWNWATGLSAGWAFNSVRMPKEYQDRALALADAAELGVDVHNSFVWGPRLKGWYDISPRLAFMVESAYLVTRPRFDVRANGVTTARRINADALILKAGFVYGVW